MIVKQKRSEPIKTILVITVGMLIVHTITKWQWAIYTSIFIGLSGIISTYLAKKIDLIWLKLAWVLSQIVPNILLSIIFYLFLTPLALVSKIFGNEYKVTIKNQEKSMFEHHKKEFDKVSFKKPW